ILQEQILSRQFADFQQALLQLQQRLERSPRQEDKDRAAVLAKVLEKSKNDSITTRFDQLVNFLRDQKGTTLQGVKQAQEKAQTLADNLRELLAILREDSRANKLREERLRLEELIKQLDKNI